MIGSRWLRLALGLAAWTVVGVFFATQTYIGSAHAQRPLTWAEAFGIGLTAWYVRAALSPIVGVLARRFPVNGEQLGRRLLIHAAAGLAWSGAATAVIQWASTALIGQPRRALSPVEFYTSLLTYVVLAGLTYAADYYRRYRDREVTASRLQAQLATARLDLLRMQLNPHFLFNALRDISELMHEDVECAQRMADDLSELVRLSLRHAGRPEVPLSEEVDFLRRYLQLEQVRFQERFETRAEAGRDAVDARMPHLILQPLVESAVRHGVAPHLERGRVEVRGRADGEALVLEVYGDSAGADSQAADGGEGLVRLELPLRQIAPAAPVEGA